MEAEIQSLQKTMSLRNELIYRAEFLTAKLEAVEISGCGNKGWSEDWEIRCESAEKVCRPLLISSSSSVLRGNYLFSPNGRTCTLHKIKTSGMKDRMKGGDCDLLLDTDIS
jgi:hypothetical protein